MLLLKDLNIQMKQLKISLEYFNKDVAEIKDKLSNHIIETGNSVKSLVVMLDSLKTWIENFTF